jgi:hypothetical protein
VALRQAGPDPDRAAIFAPADIRRRRPQSTFTLLSVSPMPSEPEQPQSEPRLKRGRWIKNGPTKRVEVQALGPKAVKAAAAQKRKG